MPTLQLFVVPRLKLGTKDGAPRQAFLFSFLPLLALLALLSLLSQ